MSAFSIRKQSPHQSGNIESPSFSALRALRGWGMASLISKHRHAHRTAPSQGTPPLFGGDRLVVRFTVGPASAAKLAVLCISFCWQRFRPNHHIGQCSVVSGSQAVWCKMAVPPAEACGCCGNPTGTWWLGRWWADRASINLSTVSLTRSGEMRRNWGKLEWGRGEKSYLIIVRWDFLFLWRDEIWGGLEFAFCAEKWPEPNWKHNETFHFPRTYKILWKTEAFWGTWGLVWVGCARPKYTKMGTAMVGNSLAYGIKDIKFLLPK